MHKTRGALLGCIAAASWLTTSCTESSSLATEPLQPVASEQRALLGGLVDGLIDGLTSLLIAPVQRKQPLANDVTWSFYAGPAGARSSNAATGLTVTIPPNALRSTERITVTALAGSAVAYSFTPHLTFARSAVLTQDLRVTNVGGLLSWPLLSGAHFADDDLTLDGNGLALVDEIVGALANPLTRTVSFGVGHFSGWIVASGRASDGGR